MTEPSPNSTTTITANKLGMEQKVLLGLQITIFFFGLIFNLLAILLIFRDKAHQTVTNIQIASLCIVDSISLLQIVFISLRDLPVDFSIKYMISNKFFCIFHLVGLHMSKTAGTWHLVAMSIDRFIVVYKPSVAIRYRKPKYALYSVIIAWSLPVPFAIPFFTLSEGSCLPFYSDDNMFYIFISISFLIFFVIPVMIMSVLYSLVLVRLKSKHISRVRASALITQYSQYTQSRVLLEPQPQQKVMSTLIGTVQEQADNETKLEMEILHDNKIGSNFNAPFKAEAESFKTTRHRKQNRLTIIILTLILVYFFCWLPLNVIFFLSDIDLDPTLHRQITDWSWILALTNSATNPLLYAFLSKQYLRALGKFLNFHFACCRRFLSCRSSAGSKMFKRSDNLLCGWRIKEAEELSNSVLNSADRKVQRSCFNWQYICAWNGMKRVPVSEHVKRSSGVKG